MAPTQAATVKAPAGRHVAGSGGQSRRAEVSSSPRRTPLQIVAPRRPRHGRIGAGLRRDPSRLLNVVAVSIVLGSLLAVVVGQAMLANGQVRLSGLENQLTLEQSSHRQGELAVSELETPSRIVAAASSQLHMVRPAQVTELPYVSLTTPLPTPTVTPGQPLVTAPVPASVRAPTTPPTTPPTTAPTTTAGGTAQTQTTSTP